MTKETNKEAQRVIDLTEKMANRINVTPGGFAGTKMKSNMSRDEGIKALFCLSLETKDPVLREFCKALICIFG
jgi:hypothetical protein